MTDKKMMGPYRLEKTIGSGGMGTVYRGVDERTGDKAAIKVLPSGMSHNEGLRERFQREIETLLQLRHPNIVRLFGFGEEEGELFYAMELVDGRSLAEVIHKEDVIPWRRAVRYAHEIATGLRQAHDMGIVHRDIKPANILITKQDKVKILDFGIARLFGSTGVTMAGGIVGTADYMAPEQAFGEGVTPKADLYSLGAVMYAMLSRQPPFRGTHVTEILDKLRYSEPIPIDRLVETIPNELSQLVSQLLEKNPDRRVPTARALCRRLEALLELDDKTDFDLNLARHATKTPEQMGDEYQLKSPEDAPPTVDPLARQMAEAPTMDLPGQSNASIRSADDKDQATEAPATIITKRGKGPQEPATRFTTVAEQRKRSYEKETQKEKRAAWWNYLQIAGLLAALGIIIGVIVLAPRQPTADMLYGQIDRAANQGDLREASAAMDDFLERFPEDSRSDYVTELREELNLRQQENRYRLASALGHSNQMLHPVEQLYLQALKLSEQNPVEAQKQLQALLMTFGPAEKQQGDVARCLVLAERRLKQLTASITNRSTQQTASIRERMNHAEKIATSQPEEARRIYRGVIQLLENTPWGVNLVADAKERLERLP